MTIPTLLIHCDDDQIVPINALARAAIMLLPKGTLKEYEGAPRAIPNMTKHELNADLFAFLNS